MTTPTEDREIIEAVKTASPELRQLCMRYLAVLIAMREHHDADILKCNDELQAKLAAGAADAQMCEDYIVYMEYLAKKRA